MNADLDEIIVQSYNIVTHSELAPLLDALSQRTGSVETRRYSYSAPMAQPTVALVLSFLLPAIESGVVKVLLGEITKDAYRLVREHFLHLLTIIKERDAADRSGRHYWENGQGAIEVGQLRFVVGAGISDEEFCRHMRRAEEMLNDLPHFVRRDTPSQSRVTFWWNAEADGWHSGI